MNIKSNCPICNDHTIRDHEIIGLSIWGLVKGSKEGIDLTLKDKKCREEFIIHIPGAYVLREKWDDKVIDEKDDDYELWAELRDQYKKLNEATDIADKGNIQTNINIIERKLGIGKR